MIAAIGFASVVSMIPGVYLFRLASGLLQIAGGSGTTVDLLSATAADGLIAVIVILAMSFGLVVPKLAIDHFSDGWRSNSSGAQQHVGPDTEFRDHPERGRPSG